MKDAMNSLSLSAAELRERYGKLYSGAVNDVLRFSFQRYQQALPSEFRPLREGMKLAGFAFTVKGGPDLVTDDELENRARLLEDLPPDSIAVWDCTGDTATAQWGEVMTMAAVRRGCRGAVVNGVRDTSAILAQDFPVFHRYCTNMGMLGRFRIYHWQRPILIGEVRVEPGDWIFGDADGVVCVPRDLIEGVLVGAEQILAKEVTIRELVRSGLRPTEVVQRGGYF